MIDISEVVIHNDIIGVVVDVHDHIVTLRDEFGTRHTVNEYNCTSVIKPQALARLFYEKAKAKYEGKENNVQ